MNTTTTWLKDVHIKTYPELKEDIIVDVAIIGGGIAGTTLAYQLSKAGKKVALINKDTLETSVTAYTTAFVTHVIDTSLVDLVKIFGEDRARDIWQSGKTAINDIEQTIKEESIDCDFVRLPEYIYATSESELKSLEDEQKTANDLGFKLELRKDMSTIISQSGMLEIPNQAKFHPLKYTMALRAAAERMGALIFDRTTAEDIIEEEEGDDKITVKTSGGIITCKDVIQATYQPFKNPTELFAQKGMYISYVFEIDVPKNTLPEALYLDQSNPYHYIRVDKGESSDRLIVGGEDHRKEIPIDPEKNYAALEEYVKKALPNVEYSIVRKWSGPILEPVDGLPFMGRYSKTNPHLYVVTGFSGNGMNFSMLASKIVTDLITNTPNLYADIYSPLRDISAYNYIKKGIDYVGEFIGGAAKNIFKDPKDSSEKDKDDKKEE